MTSTGGALRCRMCLALDKKRHSLQQNKLGLPSLVQLLPQHVGKGRVKRISVRHRGEPACLHTVALCLANLFPNTCSAFPLSITSEGLMDFDPLQTKDARLKAEG